MVMPLGQRVEPPRGPYAFASASQTAMSIPDAAMPVRPCGPKRNGSQGTVTPALSAAASAREAERYEYVLAKSNQNASLGVLTRPRPFRPDGLASCGGHPRPMNPIGAEVVLVMNV
jgi:hypothetical protein